MSYPIEDLRGCDPEHLAHMVVWFSAEKERLERHVDAAFRQLPENPSGARAELTEARWGRSRATHDLPAEGADAAR